MKEESPLEPFDLDSASIADALRKVQNGELTPAEATTLLLTKQQSVAHPRETLQQLVDRLGAPPADIVDGWCQQMRITASVYRNESGETLSEIDLNRWSLTNRGELAFDGRCYLENWDATQATDIDANTEKRIADVRDQLLGTDKSLSVSTTDVAAATPFTTDVNDSPKRNLVESEKQTRKQPANRNSPSPWPRIAMVSLGIVGLGAIIGILVISSGSGSQKAGGIAKKSPVKPNAKSSTVQPIKTGISSKGTHDQLSTDPVRPAEPMILETFDDSTSTSDDSVDIGVGQVDLGTIIKPELQSDEDNGLATPNPEIEMEISAESNDPAPDVDAKAELPAIPELKPLGDDDGDTRAPEESPQAIRTSEVTSVRLPRTDQHDKSVQLWDRSVDSFKLEFPYDVPLGLSSEADHVIDTSKKQTVAVIGRSDDATTLSWAQEANRLATANLLWHGRIKDTSADDIVYLRPAIQADPLALVLDRPDIRPTWDLSWTIPNKVTRISVDFTLPKEIEVGWIEPIDPEKPRRSRGLAVLKLTDSEDVSLGLRFDIRCSRKLSCRVRFAGKLDSEAPWTVVSRPMLERFASQLTSQSEFAAKQSTMLAKVYSDAGTEERRILRPKRDALKQHTETIRTYLERVIQLQGLISRVETSAKLNLKLWVQWHDGEQVLLETKSP